MLSPTTAEIASYEFPGRDDPGADWERFADYPELKPRSSWSGIDYLRLAWEVVRRSRRYRWHFYRLERDGLLGEEAFKGGRPYFSSKEFIGQPNWEQIPADKHFSRPLCAEGELLGDYVDRQGGGGWVVAHGHWFVKEAWGLAKILPPKTSATSIDLPALFAPYLPTIEVSERGQSDGDFLGDEAPWQHRTRVTQRHAVALVRLDLPAVDLASLIEAALASKRTELGIPEDDVRLRERVPASAVWLRAWDHAKSGKPKAKLVNALDRAIDALPASIANAPGYKRTENGESKTYPFKVQAGVWARTKLDTQIENAAELIDSEQGGPFLAHCVGHGLALLAKNRAARHQMGRDENTNIA